MKDYNIDEFIWFTPAPKSKCAINFPRERAFNLNAALCEEIGRQIDIAFHPTEPVICLRKAINNGGLKVPSSGSLKSAALNDKLLSANFKPPMRFTVTRQGDYWIAIPDVLATPNIVDLKNPSKRPRKVNPKRILEGITCT